MSIGRIQRGRIAADVLGEHFTQVYNNAMRDKRLSRRARGLLVELLTHRDGYGVSVASLVSGGPEGRDAIRKALLELEQYGYLTRTQHHSDDGQFGDMVYKVTDMPDGLNIHEPKNPRSDPMSENPTTDETAGGDRWTENQSTENQAPENQAPENPTHKKTTSKNTSFEEDHFSRGCSSTSSADARAAEDAEREDRSNNEDHEPQTPPAGSAPETRAAGQKPQGQTIPQQPGPTDRHSKALQDIGNAYRDAYATLYGDQYPPSETLATVKTDAVALLEAGWNPGYVAHLAGQLPSRGYRSLARHAEANPEPAGRTPSGEVAYCRTHTSRVAARDRMCEQCLSTAAAGLDASVPRKTVQDAPSAYQNARAALRKTA